MPWQNVWTAFNLISFWDAAEHTVFSFGYRLKVWRNHYCLKNSSMSEEIIKVWTWKKSSTSEFRLQAQCRKKSSMSKEIINSWRNYQCRSFGYRLNVWKNHQCLKKSSIPEKIINVGVSVTGSMSGNHQSILRIKSNRPHIQMFFIERELRWRPKNLRVAHWERTIIIQSYLQVEKKESPRKTFDTVYRCLLRYLAPHKENIFIHERVSTWSPYIPGYKGEQVSHRWGLNNTRTLRRSCLVILKLARSVSNWAVPLHHKITGISAELCEQLGGAVASRLILWAIGRCRCITTE